jgi:hypothetical protein
MSNATKIAPIPSREAFHKQVQNVRKQPEKCPQASQKRPQATGETSAALFLFDRRYAAGESLPNWLWNLIGGRLEER